jgi:hypothetical protein
MAAPQEDPKLLAADGPMSVGHFIAEDRDCVRKSMAQFGWIIQIEDVSEPQFAALKDAPEPSIVSVIGR